ncbi:hypothetical protein [Streptomyces sp. NPDC058280]|uniref:hypothetical protein n=1 Tax=Streptomyces sp. NPDC058280 TaxID=3346419 RepID=UPI0036EE7D9F
MASTHESGGYPNSANRVTSGSQCAQLFADKTGDGSANFGIRGHPHGDERAERYGAVQER